MALSLNTGDEDRKRNPPAAGGGVDDGPPSEYFIFRCRRWVEQEDVIERRIIESYKMDRNEEGDTRRIGE